MSTAFFPKEEWQGDPEFAQKVCQDALEYSYSETELDEDDFQLDAVISRYAVACSRPDGRLKVTYHTGPCHSGLNQLEGPVIAMASAPTVDDWRDQDLWGAGRHSFDYEMFEGEDFNPKLDAYWHWLMHESRWRDVFLTKPSPEEAAVRGVLVNTRLPSNFVVQGLIGTRQPHEYTHRVLFWHDWVQAGGDPDLCLMFSECFEPTPSGTLLHSSSGDIHDMFRSSKIGKVHLRNFVRDKFVNPNPMLHEDPRYGGIHALYGERDVGYGAPDSYLKKLLKGLSDGFTEEYVYVFGKGNVKKIMPTLTREGGARLIADLSNQLKKELQ